jgi:hypothetical protein
VKRNVPIELVSKPINIKDFLPMISDIFPMKNLETMRIIEAKENTAPISMAEKPFSMRYIGKITKRILSAI